MSRSACVHGYIHCIPYGYVLFGPTPSPPDAANNSVPFLFRLSPRHPGYVMTVCAEMREEKVNRHKAVEIRLGREETIVGGLGLVVTP